MKDIIRTLIEHGENCPNQVAVKHNDEILTYEALNRFANQLAILLKDAKTPLILYGHMSPFMIVGMIGSMKAGCGYVPLDTSIPQDRILSIINKIEPRFIFNTTDEQLEIEDISFISKDLLTGVKQNEDTVSKIKDSDIAYTIFTSGSTGEPKGVQISYESLNLFTNWMLELNQVGSNQQWLNQAPFSFDLSVMSIYPCLMTAGTLNLVDKTMINKPKLLNEMLEESKINVWVSTPSFMEMCLMLPRLTEAYYSNLKEFFFCGEILANKTAKLLLQRFPSAYIYNTYGPTEATVAVTSILVTEEVINQYNPLPVGLPQPGTKLSLTHEGELIISGKCVSEGYVKDELRSKKVFNKLDGQKSYYTGDKAQFINNQWFINGRIDYQIKLNGYRMELEEIEFQLRKLEKIRDAIVVPTYKNNKVTHLNAAVILNHCDEVKEVQTLTHDIKTELKPVLPEYMIPKKIIYMKKLPLTMNGKLDRKKIAEAILK
ncbi:MULTISPECIES: D-alanine--poly(phosphoribitol) ligase subunit DltA [Staphylococcus]|uniref:D-alanine--D-alanyl carrier protein ligase n=1 Tax=Staphylococcus cohnii TaxID=29382 RepID=A0A2T4LV28_9STAP|nr:MULTISPECIES: D-alanine--poly(phosphoribitol) ligase subunit DltA [Staphylococcus]MCE5033261.1 D-alanine--poly(phosphoribitol) ligase subunit DltA [Staphylococcus cohnii]PTF21549.1 D-alanine--poly(phosphoribitol) ligase subunit 1 [Staphylococcus cohnii]PTF22466.1 D-alanine--poly(phosphoribitol) ligase subunit 1 [Staphylococcus cohnii]PTF29221.1 D-alanine--poly(phosphoribitol) ligase subunit 1 [Staphylococcus cohnii]PTF33279.1 D-alanine--poly(phosphoribitol) ligase subunit 1 [Staphylococcus 